MTLDKEITEYLDVMRGHIEINLITEHYIGIKKRHIVEEIFKLAKPNEAATNYKMEIGGETIYFKYPEEVIGYIEQLNYDNNK